MFLYFLVKHARPTPGNSVPFPEVTANVDSAGNLSGVTIDCQAVCTGNVAGCALYFNDFGMYHTLGCDTNGKTSTQTNCNNYETNNKDRYTQWCPAGKTYNVLQNVEFLPIT